MHACSAYPWNTSSCHRSTETTCTEHCVFPSCNEQMEHKGHVAATKLVASLKDDNMRRKQSLHDAASKERLLLSGIAGCKAQATNLRHKKRTLAEQVRHQLSMCPYAHNKPYLLVEDPIACLFNPTCIEYLTSIDSCPGDIPRRRCHCNCNTTL